jgi:transposase
MTPAEEAEFIALWNQGLEITAIAQRLGIPKGTVQSRAHRLQQRGLIQPRPKGGAYPRQKALARQDQAPVQTSADPPLEVMHPPVHTVHRVQAQLYALRGAVQQEVESTIDLRVLLSEALAPLLAQVTALEREIKALRMHPSAPVHSSVYALHGAEHTDRSPEDRKSERWNIYMGLQALSPENLR